jgi:predicted Zn-dependent peptidase
MSGLMTCRLKLLAAFGLAAIVLGTAGRVDAQIDRSVVPTLGPPPEVKLPPVTVRQLKNGLKLMIVERHQLPVADFVLTVPVGSAQDPANKGGVADLMAEMLTEGTTSRTSLQVDDQASFLGVSVNANSGWDATRVTLTTPTAQLDSALALFADVALRPAFPAADFDRRKQQRLTALLQVKDDGPEIADRVFPAIIFGMNHPYGRPSSGTEASVGGMTAGDVSQFYKTHFFPNGSTMVIVGDVQPDRIESRIDALFGGWRQGTAPAMTVPVPPARTEATAIYLIDKPDAPQSSFRIGSIGVARSTPDYFPIQVMNTTLGGSFTSRLNQNLRESKGYTYGAFSGFGMRKGKGPFVARAEVVAAKSDSALLEFMRELRAIRDTVPSSELKKTKSYLELQLPSRFETTSDIAQAMTTVAEYGLPLDYYNHFVANIEAVSQSDVQRVARTYIDPGHIAVVIVGDRKSIEPALRTVNVGPIYIRNMEGGAVQ